MFRIKHCLVQLINILHPGLWDQT